jgi:hypothetical protein
MAFQRRLLSRPEAQMDSFKDMGRGSRFKKKSPQRRHPPPPMTKGDLSSPMKERGQNKQARKKERSLFKVGIGVVPLLTQESGSVDWQAD